MKLIVAFHNFANAPKNVSSCFGADTTSRTDRRVLHVRRYFVFDYVTKPRIQFLLRQHTVPLYAEDKAVSDYGGTYCVLTVKLEDLNITSV
jgi:hypothetical protein